VINANPIAYGSSGSRSFFSDQSMVIRENYGPEPATVNSKELREGSYQRSAFSYQPRTAPWPNRLTRDQ
jgi:hypothetical protein